MTSQYTGHENSNWLKINQPYNKQNQDSDPFFDPHSLTITNNEFKPVPLPEDDFEPYLEKFNDIDNMLNETLGFQELTIPNGYHLPGDFDQINMDLAKKHSRKISGSAIFGFVNSHTHQLSIPGVNVTEQSFKKMNDTVDYYNNYGTTPRLSNQHDFAPAKREASPTPQRPPTRSIELQNNKQDDFIITGKTPVDFKFPSNRDSKASPRSQSTDQRNFQEQAGERLQQQSQYTTYSNENQFLPPQFYEMQNSSPNNTFSVEYINRLQELSGNPPFNQNERKNKFINEIEPYLTNNDMQSNTSPDKMNPNRNNFYLLPPEQNLGKPVLTLLESNLEYSSPEEYFSSPNNSPILPQNLFVSPQHNPPRMPDLQTPEKMKLPPAPKLQPASLMTPKKYTIVAKNQEDIAEQYNYSPGESFTETPKKQMKNDDTDNVFWTPVLIRKDDPNTSKIIEDQKKRVVSPKRKETKITSTLPKGHLDQYFEGPNSEEKFTCIFNNCGKQFSRISNTRAHIQTHLCDRPFSCQLCPKKFVRQHDLRRHEKSHQEFTFECPCGKKFPRQDALKRHRIRKICSGAIEDDKPVSPDKKLVSKPLKKKGRPKKEDELHDGLRDRILEELTYGSKGLDFDDYLETGNDMEKSENFLLNDMLSHGDQQGFVPEPSDNLDEFGYEEFNI